MKWTKFSNLRHALRLSSRKFTDRAIRVLALARQEATGRRHFHLTTEHVLLAMEKAGPGAARKALGNLGFDLAQERNALEAALDVIPPDSETKDVIADPLYQELVNGAVCQARALQHNCVGTEHLLLALLAPERSALPQVLANRGIAAERVRDELLNLLRQPRGLTP